MWRAMMMSLGLSLCLLGGEAMVIDRVVLANEMTDSIYRNQYRGGGVNAPFSPYEVVPSYSPSLPAMNQRVFVPPEWAPLGITGCRGADISLRNCIAEPTKQRGMRS